MLEFICLSVIPFKFRRSSLGKFPPYASASSKCTWTMLRRILSYAKMMKAERRAKCTWTMLRCILSYAKIHQINERLKGFRVVFCEKEVFLGSENENRELFCWINEKHGGGDTCKRRPQDDIFSSFTTAVTMPVPRRPTGAAAVDTFVPSLQRGLWRYLKKLYDVSLGIFVSLSPFNLTWI